ncbi:MAG: flagellin [Bryobacteraceae bacterium]
MFPISGATQSYLAGLNRTETEINQAQSEVTSGYRVQTPSDDPAAIPQILQFEADLNQNQQIQSNLSAAGSELSSADSALQSAVQAIVSATSLAAQGAGTSVTASDRADLATQVQGLLQTLVGISQTQVNGRYIFSGDQSSSPMYVLNASGNGVTQQFSASSTRVIVDTNGNSIPIAETAQQIFDPQNSDGTPATGNVFAAVTSLLTALQNNDQTGITQAATDLQSADTYLNQQLAFYGEAEDRVTSATNLATQFQTQITSELSNLRDADIPTVAVQLTQSQLDEQATLSVEAQIQQQRNLFSYLG